MVSYYDKVYGNLYPGDIAKSEDINDIQTRVSDAISSVINDHHEHQSFILGSRENDFILTPAQKTFGRYIDTYSVPADEDLYELPMREYGYRQPIAKTKSSLYSFVCKMGNKTSYDIDVECSLQDISGTELRRDVVTLKANTDKREYEYIFDLRDYPTSFGLDMEKLSKNEAKNIPPRHDDEFEEEGVIRDIEEDVFDFSVGVSQLYVVFEPLNIQIYNRNEDIEGFEEELNSDSFILYADKNGQYGATFDCFLEQTQGTTYELTPYSLYFKDIYATDINYICTGGEAIIFGEKVICKDSHVTLSGASEYGNVLSLIYMDINGHLHSANSKASSSVSTKIEDWEMDDVLPPSYLLIAKALIYNNVNKEPLIIQDDTTQETRPRSHHERLRRLEKELDYTKDISIPPRIKYTVTGSDWVETDGDLGLLSAIYPSASTDNDADKYPVYVTLDSKGNLVVKTTESQVTTYSVTLKDDEIQTNSSIIATSTSTDTKTSSATIKAEDTKTQLDTYEKNDLRKLNRISEMQNIKIDSTNGVISLKIKSAESNTTTNNSQSEVNK